MTLPEYLCVCGHGKPEHARNASPLAVVRTRRPLPCHTTGCDCQAFLSVVEAARATDEKRAA